jgi:hypothetical protein
MTPNARPSERVAVLAAHDPDVHTAAAYVTAYVAAKNYASFLAIIFAGTLGASATLDAKILQATDASGTGAKDLAGAAITQLTQAGTDSDKQALINFRAEDLDINNGFTHVAVSMTIGTATSDAGAVLLGLDPRNFPASENDSATVDEIVTA